MVGISDGNNDGKFKIQRGQGLSQAIASELGLNSQQCKKLGSVWTQIFKEVDKQNEQTKIYSGGNDLSGPINQNYVVQNGQEVSFSSDIWNTIVRLVNEKLGLNITAGQQAEDADGSPEAADAEGNPPVATDDVVDVPTEDTPLQVTVSMEGTAPRSNIRTWHTQEPNVKDAVKKLKGETQSNWAVSSKMKDALKTVNKDNVAYFINEYNSDGSNIAKDIDGCMGWNKKDVYENLTSKLIARAKEQGIDISKYDIEPKTKNSARTGATPTMAITEYPSIEAQQKFLKEVSALIVEGEFAKRYETQITKANATIKQLADAPVENITMTKPQDPKNGNYQLILEDGSTIYVGVSAGVITKLAITNKTSPDNISDLEYRFDTLKVLLDPDEKADGSGYYRKNKKFSNNNTIPFDRLKQVATDLLKKMGVEFTKE